MSISVTIVNNTAGSVGPYNGQTITTGNSLVVTSQLSSFATDTNLISDILLGNSFLSIGSISSFSPLDSISIFQDLAAAPISWTYSNLTGNSTTTVKSGLGILHGIMMNNNSTQGVVKVYDNTAGSGTLISTIQCGSPSGGLLSSTRKSSTFICWYS